MISAIIPCTNPEATPVIKAIFAIKGRNAVILAPHPRTKGTNRLITDMMRDTLRRYGAPEDLIMAIEEPTVDFTFRYHRIIIKKNANLHLTVKNCRAIILL